MSDTAAATAPLRRRSIQVDVYFDLICPWCLIGKRQLERAIDLIALGYPDIDVSVAWKCRCPCCRTCRFKACPSRRSM